MDEETEVEVAPLEEKKKSRGPLIAVAVLLALIVVGAAAWFTLGRPAVTATADAGTPAPVDAGSPQSLDPAEGDALIGDVVPSEWRVGGDLIRRAASAVYNVSIGQSPGTSLGFLDPHGEFLVDEQDPNLKGKPAPKPKSKKPQKKKKNPKLKPSRFFISEKNDERYDKATKALTAIDAALVGRTYARVRPYLESAFREIAPPGKTFDAAFIAAVDRLAAVPIADGPREVIPADVGITYRWADPKLEALKPAEKHLLRMGPKNARAVVKQLQAFRTAMAEADAGM